LSQVALAELLNAFAWVHRSTRPILLSHPGSEVWHRRLLGCGYDFSNDVTGICLVPLLDLNGPWQSKGVILMTSTAHCGLLPAHVFLLSRLARDLAGFLTPLMPFPGFPWWPKVGVGRGGI